MDEREGWVRFVRAVTTRGGRWPTGDGQEVGHRWCSTARLAPRPASTARGRPAGRGSISSESRNRSSQPDSSYESDRRTPPNRVERSARDAAGNATACQGVADSEGTLTNDRGFIDPDREVKRLAPWTEVRVRDERSKAPHRSSGVFGIFADKQVEDGGRNRGRVGPLSLAGNALKGLEFPAQARFDIRGTGFLGGIPGEAVGASGGLGRFPGGRGGGSGGPLGRFRHLERDHRRFLAVGGWLRSDKPMDWGQGHSRRLGGFHPGLLEAINRLRQRGGTSGEFDGRLDGPPSPGFRVGPELEVKGPDRLNTTGGERHAGPVWQLGETIGNAVRRFGHRPSIVPGGLERQRAFWMDRGPERPSRPTGSTVRAGSFGSRPTQGFGPVFFARSAAASL